MSRRNAFLARQEATQQAYIEASERVTRQLMVDSMMIVLNRDFGFGFDRIKKLVDALTETYDQYHDALDGGVEADYVQEKLDAAIRAIMQGKEEFCPFRERYPEIKAITYKPRKQ